MKGLARAKQLFHHPRTTRQFSTEETLDPKGSKLDVMWFGCGFGKLFVPRGLGKSQGPRLFCTGALSLESLKTIINLLQPGGLPVR